jgi:hypothetical protein
LAEEWAGERAGGVADKSPPSRVEVKKNGAITPLPPVLFLGVILKPRDDFIFNLMMEAASPPEMFINIKQKTRRHLSEVVAVCLSNQ